MPRGIAARIGLILLTFMLLVAGSVGATALTLRTLETDAVVINLAGRQSTLVQGITRHALEIEKHAPQGDDEVHREALRAAADQFDQTLDALSDGGEAPYVGEATVTLPATTNPDLLEQLATVRKRWLEFRGYAEPC